VGAAGAILEKCIEKMNQIDGPGAIVRADARLNF
jgi:hypothetical protein